MSNIVSKYNTLIENALYKAENHLTKLTEKQFNLEGMSSNKTRIFLNELIFLGSNYLEIGVYKGSTFISALYNNNHANAVAIDNFSQFDGLFTDFINNCVENELKNCRFIINDCFNLNSKETEIIKNNKFDIYLYDGDHYPDSQRKALTYYINDLSDIFIYMVDDWNWVEVQEGARMGIKDVNVKVHKEWVLPARYNGDTENWWNGFYVAILEKQ